jgi:hypothetical protein
MRRPVHSVLEARYEGLKTSGERMMALTAAQRIQISMLPIQNGG